MGCTSEPGGHERLSFHSAFILPAPSLHLILSSLMQRPSHWPSAFSLTHPICLPHPSKPDVVLFSWKPSNRLPHCPQDSTPFISTLITYSCPLCSALSLTELPAVSRIGHVLSLFSGLGSCRFFPLPVCTASFLLGPSPGSAPPGSLPSHARAMSSLWSSVTLYASGIVPVFPPLGRASAGWGAVSRCRVVITGEVLAVAGSPLPGIGGRNRETKVGYLYP